MPIKKTTSQVAASLYESGLVAYKSKSYSETIRYLKKAQMLGLTELEYSQADRFIGLSYMSLGKGAIARRYLRRATTDGLFSGSSIISLVQSEEKRSPISKWIRGEDHNNKIDELMDWFLSSDILNKNNLELVANYAIAHKKWHKAFLLLERLKMLDASNLHHRTNLVLACYWLGDFVRVQIETEELFKSYSLPVELLSIRGEIKMLLGDFSKARECYLDLANTSKTDMRELLQSLDLYVRASELSDKFKNNAIYFLVKGYLTKTYIESIDNIEHFELILNAISTFFEIHQREQDRQLQELTENVRMQHSQTYQIYESSPKNTSESQQPKGLLSPFERVAIRQKLDIEAIRDLQVIVPVLNSAQNLLFADQFRQEVWKTRFFLKSRVWFYKLAIILFRVVLFSIPAFILADGLFDAITGNNLYDVLVPSMVNSTTPSWIQITVALLWFVTLIFADEVLIGKLNNKLVDSLRETLKSHIGMIAFSLASGLGVQTILEAAQPLPNIHMDVPSLMEYGLNGKKLWETRLAAMEFAEQKATKNDLESSQKKLINMVNSEREELKFIAARLLAITQNPESLPVLKLMLNNNDERNIYSGLRALGRLQSPQAIDAIVNHAIATIDNTVTRIGIIEILKSLPLEISVNSISQIIERCVKIGVEPKDYLGALEKKGDIAANAILSILRNYPDSTNLFDRFDLILAILNTDSRAGYDQVRYWLTNLDKAETLSRFFLGADLDMLVANNKFDMIKDIASDETVDIEIRKIAVSKLVVFEKENIQDIVFRLWGISDKSKEFIEVLGDLGSEFCVSKLKQMLIEKQVIKDDLEYTSIFTSLAVSGLDGERVLRDILNSPGSSGIEKMFALSALFGCGIHNKNLEKRLKPFLADPSIDKHYRLQITFILHGCVIRKESNYFRRNNRSRRIPKYIYSFLEWMKDNPDLPDDFRRYAESDIEQFKMSEDNSIMWIPEDLDKDQNIFSRIRSLFRK